MKICFLTNINSIHSQRWVRFFADKGHIIHIITFEKPELEFPNISVHWIDINKRFIISSILLKLLSIKRCIRSINPDIIHANYITKYGIIGALTGFHPLVVSAWGSDLWVDSKGWMKYFSQHVLKTADIVHCDAKSMINELITFGCNPQKIVIIYYGTDIKKFNPGQKDDSIKSKLGISESQIIISLRNLEPIYDIESLIRSIPAVISKNPRAQFIIAGRGSQEIALKDLASSLKITDNVHFIGSIPNEKIPFYLTSANIYISTSLSDGGLAASTAEAMACGLPVIITNYGDNTMWVEEGVNGFIIPLKAPDEISKKINLILDSKELQIRFGKKNQEIIQEKNNYYIEMDKMEYIYQSLIVPKKI